MNEIDANSLLLQLNLTEYEAKTLTALFKLREAEAPQLSRIAQVPKTRVYDVLDRLIKRGLVIEIYGRPKKYRAIDAGKVFELLINEKRVELKKIEERTKKLKDFISIEAKGESVEKVMKVKDKNDFMRILAQEISSAKNSVVAFTNLGKDYNLVNESLKNLATKNVEIRLIGKIGEEAKKVAKEYNELGIGIKEFEHGMHAYILDGKKVILALSDLNLEKPEYHFTIWPKNKPMSEALQGYFEQLWSKVK